MTDRAAVILAAGRGTRMKSDLCKVLHHAAGLPMISYVLATARSAGFSRTVVVIGHQADEVRGALDDPTVEFALQQPQLGTGHAVAAARDVLQDFSGNVLVLCGDVPLLEPETIRQFLRSHTDSESRVSVMTTVLDDPHGYGRIVRDDRGRVIAIVEQRDADHVQQAIREVNTGIFLVERDLLFTLLERVRPDNDQGEYYLTDIVEESVKDGVPVHGCILENPAEAIGVNSRSELARISSIIWERRREELMASGVTLLDPSTVYVDSQVSVGRDTIIHPNVMLSGSTTIGRHCVIESGVYITDSQIADCVNIRLGSRLDLARVDEGTAIGPMAHLRPEAHIGRDARIGNFVEVKKSNVGNGSKASHLTYLGDTTIGEKVNIGCGTITCNYDGKKKHRTVIGDRCFVGSDVQFVAPVEIGEGSVIGAGSTITRDVPAGSLAVSRARQKVYALRAGQGPGASNEDRKS